MAVGGCQQCPPAPNPTDSECVGVRQSAPLLDATRASASAIGLPCRYVGYGRGSSLRAVRFVGRRLAVLAQVRRPGGGQRDARAASRHMMARDEPAVVGCFPHREARTRGSPRLEYLGVRTRAWADPLEEANDQGVDGVRHERRRSGEHSPEAGARRLRRRRRTARVGSSGRRARCAPHDRGANGATDVLSRIRRPVGQPAPNPGEACSVHASLGISRAREHPRGEAHEFREVVPGNAVDHLPNARDVAFASALHLENSAWAQRLRQPHPHAVVVGDPMKRRGRDDHVDSIDEIEVKHLLAPHLCAIAEPFSGFPGVAAVLSCCEIDVCRRASEGGGSGRGRLPPPAWGGTS